MAGTSPRDGESMGTIDEIRWLMENEPFEITVHARERMAERGTSTEELIMAKGSAFIRCYFVATPANCMQLARSSGRMGVCRCLDISVVTLADPRSAKSALCNPAS